MAISFDAFYFCRQNLHPYAGSISSIGIVRNRDLITKFDVIYGQTWNEIQLIHGANCNIHLLLAVPAPIAVQCGLSLLPGKDPNIWAYDYDKELGGFIKTLKIN